MFNLFKKEKSTEEEEKVIEIVSANRERDADDKKINSVFDLACNIDEKVKYLLQNEEDILLKVKELERVGGVSQDRIKETADELKSLTQKDFDMSSSISELLDGFKKSGNIVNTANEGIVMVQSKMEALSYFFHDIVKSFGDLQTEYKNISKIANLISEIATETNMLSLNAAIEAARAGDAGTGFAVVANEIKNLSDNTELKVKDIIASSENMSEIIKELIKKSSEGSELINEAVNRISVSEDVVKEIVDSQSAVKNISNSLITGESDKNAKVRKVIDNLYNMAKKPLNGEDDNIEELINSITARKEYYENIEKKLKEIKSLKK